MLSDPTRTVSEAQERALTLLRESDRFLLTGHVRPDGDCIGAQAALWSVLRACGKEVVILNPDPPSPCFDYLSSACPFGVYDGGAIPAHDVCVLLDISVLERCGTLAEPLGAAPSRKLVIDHHVAGDQWWDEAFLDVGCAATGLLVRRIAHALEVPLNSLSAEAIFTSMVTDTGWFKYSNTNVECFEAAAELLSAGVLPARLYSAVFQRTDGEQPRMIGRALDRLEYFSQGRLAVVDWPATASTGGLGGNGGAAPSFEETDVLLDIVRSVESVEVVIFLRELEDGSCKLSARSKTDYDVQALASEFGGGGHVKAAGATLEGPLVNARARLVASALQRLPGVEGEVQESSV